MLVASRLVEHRTIVIDLLAPILVPEQLFERRLTYESDYASQGSGRQHVDACLLRSWVHELNLPRTTTEANPFRAIAPSFRRVGSAKTDSRA